MGKYLFCTMIGCCIGEIVLHLFCSVFLRNQQSGKFAQSSCLCDICVNSLLYSVLSEFGRKVVSGGRVISDPDPNLIPRFVASGCWMW